VRTPLYGHLNTNGLAILKSPYGNATLIPMNDLTLNYFDQVYIINLKTRTDRRAEMAVQLESIGLDFNAPHVTLFEAVKPATAEGFPSAGARGCFMSHLEILREAKRKGLRSVLILEDDFNFAKEFIPTFERIQGVLSGTAWGMFYGSYALTEALVYSAQPCVRVDPEMGIQTTALVAINGPCMAPLIRYLEAILARPPGDPLGGPMHVDGAYCWFRQTHPEVQTWISTKTIGYQRASKTDIHRLQWFDRLTGSAWAVSLLRRLRNRWRTRR
jgi:glycosyl transferase, family 25